MSNTQERNESTVQRSRALDFEQAQVLIVAAHAHARTLGVAVTTAVVDAAGLLIALGRMDGAPALSPQIAEAKAVGAAVLHKAGDELAALQSDRPAFFSAAARMVRVPVIAGLGSLLIRDQGAIIGAIGISGATSEQDVACGTAALNVRASRA